MTLRLVGTCPVCERQQKVTPAGAMVHHGFRRPGRGYIIGDCFGVHKAAYELSPNGCIAYREWCQQVREQNQNYLSRLREEPETITTEPDRQWNTKTYRRDSTGSERYAYEKTLERKIWDVEYMIKDLLRSEKRMTELIQKWAPAPLVEIDEEGLTPQKREERVARKNERDTKRAEKDEKRRALQIKRNERLAKKATQLLFFFDEFERLAQQPPSTARNLYARDLIFEMSKTKYNIQYPQDLWRGPDDGAGNHTAGPWGDEMIERASKTLVALGVGRPWEHAFNGRERDFFRADAIPVYSSSGNKIRVPELTKSPEEALEDIRFRRT